MVAAAACFMWYISEIETAGTDADESSRKNRTVLRVSNATVLKSIGTVIDSVTGDPLDEATLFASGTATPDVPLTSDSTGNFDPSDLPAEIADNGFHWSMNFLPMRPSRWEVRDAPGPGSRGQTDSPSVAELISRMPRAELEWNDARGRLLVRAPPTGDVELVIRDHDGDLVASRTVDVYAIDGRFSSHDSIRLIGQTDEDGRLQMRSWTGHCRFVITVPGTGTTVTGVFEVLPGQSVHVETPRLARFGIIDGRLPEKLASGIDRVQLGQHAWNRSSASVAADGSFTLYDVTPGWHYVGYHHSPTQSGNRLAVDVAPGERITGFELSAPPPARTSSIPPTVETPPQPILSISGVVRSRRGKPVPDVPVYLCTGNSFTHPSSNRVVRAFSDSHGVFEFHDESMLLDWHFNRVFLVAGQSSGAPSILCLRSFHLESVTKQSSRESWNLRADVTLPDHQGTLTVKVLQKGQPRSDAFVQISDEYADSVFGDMVRYRGSSDSDPARQELSDLFRAWRKVDHDGTAKFSGLVPGRHRVTAVAGVPQDEVAHFAFHDVNSMRRNQVRPDWRLRNIDIVAGVPQQLTMDLQSQPDAVKLQIDHPHGSVLASGAVSLAFDRDDFPTWSRHRAVEDLSISPRFPGLRYVGVWSRRSGVAFRKTKSGAVFTAKARVAVSPLLQGRTLRMTSEFFDDDTQSLTVRLLGQGGNPVRGTISLFEPNRSPTERFHASTDDDGTVTFRSLPGGRYRVRGMIDGAIRPPDPGPGMTADNLTGHGLVPYGEIEIGRDGPYELTLKEVPAGYVRGQVEFPDGANPHDYTFAASASAKPDARLYISGRYPNPWFSNQVRRPATHFDPGSGLLTCGPFLTRSAELDLQHKTQQWSPYWPYFRSGLHRESIDVEPGQLTATSFAVQLPAPEPEQVWPDWQDTAKAELARKPKGLVVQVRLANGVPAWAADVKWFRPRYRFSAPDSLGRTDPHGRLEVSRKGLFAISEYGGWPDPASQAPQGTPEQFGVIVSLPGHADSQFIPVTEDVSGHLEVELPAPVRLPGRVTVAGHSPEAFGDSVRVVARYQELGRLSRTISRECLTEPDGSFVFDGLTPGSYHLQAVLDDIWISPTEQLDVPPGGGQATLPQVTLKIATPGSTAHVLIVDASQQPVSNTPVHVAFPPGPISQTLHARPLITNKRGLIWIDGCTAGRHNLTVGSHGNAIAFDVPPHDRPDQTRQVLLHDR